MKSLSLKAERVAISKITFRLLVTVMFVPGVGFSPLQRAGAAQKLTASDMIEAELPRSMTIAHATDDQLLDAVCKAVRKSAKDAGLIVRTGAGARPGLRTDFLCRSIRCAHESGVADCDWVREIVREWIKKEPTLANQLMEAVAQCAPDCRDLFQNVGEGNFTTSPSNINPPPGTIGGGGGAIEICVVCHNGSNVEVPCSDVQDYLRSHRGDTVGACQATPITNP
jgi:hypothetical protein